MTDHDTVQNFKAPQNVTTRKPDQNFVFLAGSIDMGSAENWQKGYTYFFNELGIGVFNPRRDDWDSSWEQTPENAQFYQQVSWELDAMSTANFVVVRFASNSHSPITLLELGILAERFAAKETSLYVVCPDDYWRSGNVNMVCIKYDIPLFKSDNDFFNFVKRTFGE